ncbi:MAG: hypothetical protein D6730_12970 [Bacteroidetes bacterium]|nr:MAG: hypothetical protein D6730_12970 [Bacteroidota bacterium]
MRHCKTILLIGCCLGIFYAGLYAQSARLLRRMLSSEQPLAAMAFSPAGKYLAGAGMDGNLKVWDMQAGREALTLGHTLAVYALAYSPDGSKIASGDASGNIKVWGVHRGELLYRLKGHTDRINALVFGPGGKQLFSVSEDGSLRLWRLEDKVHARKVALPAAAQCLDVSPDGRYLAWGDWDGYLHLWETASLHEVATYEAHGGQVNALRFSPHGRWLASGGADKRIQLWDIQSGELLKSLRGHSLAVYDLAFSPGMQWLVSAGRDRSAVVWNIQQGRVAYRIRHPFPVTAVGFSPNGKLLATAGREGVLRVFLRPDAEVTEQQSESEALARQDAFQGKSEVDFQLPPFQGSNPHAVAVVIGIRDYEHPDIPAVDYALQDAGSIRTYLTEVFGFDESHILFLPNASQAELRGTFGTEENYQARLYNLVEAGKSDVFVYYSGHGAPGTANGQPYLVPSDCDPSLLAFQGYSVQTLYRNLARIPFRSLTLVMDACFSGGSEKGSLIRDASPVFIKPKNPVIRQQNARILAACRGNEIASWYPAKSHSLFTYYFLKGLQGEANLNRDEVLSLEELSTYLSEQVPAMARKLKNRQQQPHILGEGRQILLRY